ncbi:caspase family protein [Azospirillum agricola]|uniref:caspase family protein n=1 Tax=Azospirillum agricola TaxID=1720247 RepID=UPI000A0F07E1|nr:caspase family protein [Azospirillum agricola]SMH31852.1 Caspase domain-containing protein [Azospirillum lipoferum]
MPAAVRKLTAAILAGSCLVGSCLVASHALAAPATRALVVGINAYTELKPLKGAVADANDIADALGKLDVPTTRLLDGQATRKAILGTLDRMVAEAKSGDTIVFTYAGHGGVEKGRDPSIEALDQTILLGGFTARKPGNGERIIDDEIYERELVASKKGVRLVFVFDSCHSGTMYRSIDPRAGEESLRSQIFDIVGGDALGPIRTHAPGPPPDGVFHYAAGQDSERVPEIVTPALGYRGAFSIAFAEALRGGADRDRDGWITHGELQEYLLPRTRALADGRQNPNFAPDGFRGTRLFQTSRGAEQPDQPATVRLRVIGMAADAAAELAGRLRGVTLVGQPDQPADLVWDAGKREAVSAGGDVVATGIGPDRLDGLAEKWQALVRLKAHKTSLVMRALPDDRARKAGETVGLAVEGVNGGSLTILNLAGDGTVNFLYPRYPGEEKAVAGEYRNLDFSKAIPPFGADHIIALSSTALPKALHERLKSLDDRRLAGAAVDAVLGVLASDPKARIGVQIVVAKPQ